MKVRAGKQLAQASSTVSGHQFQSESQPAVTSEVKRKPDRTGLKAKSKVKKTSIE